MFITVIKENQFDNLRTKFYFYFLTWLFIGCLKSTFFLQNKQRFGASDMIKEMSICPEVQNEDKQVESLTKNKKLFLKT